jgi:hypothetical protein
MERRQSLIVATDFTNDLATSFKDEKGTLPAPCSRTDPPPAG